MSCRPYAVSGVRDRDAIADWLRLVREEAEHRQQTDVGAQAQQPPTVGEQAGE